MLMFNWHYTTVAGGLPLVAAGRLFHIGFCHRALPLLLRPQNFYDKSSR
jgi:hypothetical protein